MSDPQFEAKIIAARPQDYGANTTFTDKVMSSIQSSEILSAGVRNMSVNTKETPFMKLRQLPKFAIAAIAVGALLVISGSAYAAYKILWPQPEVHVSAPTTTTSGRQEVAISFEQCGANDLASHYQLKKNATITIDEVPMVVQAHCELDAIGNWANNTFPHDQTVEPLRTDKEYDKVELNTSMATHIQSQTASSITFAGLTKYNQTDTSLAVTSKTRFIANGVDVSASKITASDPVVYVTSETIHVTQSANCTPQSCSSSGKLVSTDLVAVVKLDMPFQYYDQFAWQSLTEVDTCAGNPNDACLSGFAGAIDLYSGNAATDGTTQMKEIQGVITQRNGTTTTIRSSSGTLFTIVTPSDVITAYNTQKAAQYYNNQTVKVGSSLDVRYVEKTDQHTRTITAGSLLSVQLQTEQVGKSDPVTAY